MSGTTNLGITYIQASQNQKEVTTNAAFDALDKALTETFDANLASASVTLTDAQYRQALAVRAQNATVAARTVTLPARERLSVLIADVSCTQDVGFVRGSTTLTLAPGQAALARTDGSTNGLTALLRGTAAMPVTSFLALADTPASYAGQGGRGLRVAAGETGLEFADLAAAAHSHAATDITAGTLATARLGTGTADATTFLRGDGAWTVPPAAAVAFTPAGTIAANTAQAAIEEVNTEKLAKAGDTMTGNLTLSLGSPVLVLDRASGAAGQSFLSYRAAGLSRWAVNVTGAESSGNAGSIFYLQGFDDAGTLARNYLQVTRNTWQMSVNGAALGSATFSVRTDGAAPVEAAIRTNSASADTSAETLWEASTFATLRAGFAGRRAGANGDAVLKSAVAGTLRDHLVLKGDGSATLGVGANAITVTATGQVQVPVTTPVAPNDLVSKAHLDGRVISRTTDPTADDDSGDGYAVGAIWINTARNVIWLCRDASAGAAQWEPFLSRRALHGGYGSDPDQVMATGPLNGTSGAGVTVVNRLYLRPFRWFGGRPIDRLFGRVTAAGTASNIKFGLWGHDYALGRPTGLPLGANNTPLSTTTTGIKSAAIAPVDPAPGILWVASIHEGTTTPGMQAAPAGHWDVWEFTPIPGGDFGLLIGAANQGSYGLICNDVTFAADITAIDLTSAVFARSSGNAAIHPHVMIGF